MIDRALKLIRVFHELSQSELAEKLGISTSYLSELENGRKAPQLDLLQKYSDVFRIPISSILLFAERLDQPITPSRRWISDKVLKLLEFVNARAK